MFDVEEKAGLRSLAKANFSLEVGPGCLRVEPKAGDVRGRVEAHKSIKTELSFTDLSLRIA